MVWDDRFTVNCHDGIYCGRGGYAGAPIVRFPLPIEHLTHT